MSDEELLKLIRGWTVEGYSVNQLNADLAGESSSQVVDRILASEVLRPAAIEIVRYAKRSPSLDRAIMTALSDESNWSGPGAHQQLVGMKAYALAYPALATELMYVELSRPGAGLAICLMTPVGRKEIHRVLEKMLRIPLDQRTLENPDAAKLSAEVQAIVSKYGTDEYLRGKRENSVAVRPPKGQSVEGGVSPTARGSAVVAGEATPENEIRSRAGFRWAAAAAVGLLAVAFVIYQARRKS